MKKYDNKDIIDNRIDMMEEQVEFYNLLSKMLGDSARFCFDNILDNNQKKRFVDVMLSYMDDVENRYYLNDVRDYVFNLFLIKQVEEL